MFVKKLGIESSNISTQTLQRDRHADYYSTLALIASSIEKIGVEIRHLQRTEVREAEEFFSKKSKRIECYATQTQSNF